MSAAQYRPVLTAVQVVPPWTAAALRPLDGSYRTSGIARSVRSKCPRFQGNPGGGWRTAGRRQGKKNKLATAAVRKNGYPVLGYSYLHTALDDHSRLAYTEILADERQDTAAAFLTRAAAWYAELGMTIERVLTDNANCYRSKPWAAACAQLAITPKRTRQIGRASCRERV